MSEEKPKRRRGRPKDSKSTTTVSMRDLMELVPEHWNVDVGTAWLKRMGFQIDASEQAQMGVAPAQAQPTIKQVDKVDRPDRVVLKAKTFGDE